MATNNYGLDEWIGQKFGALTVLEPVRHISSRGDTSWYWKVRCDCGQEKIVVPYSTIKSQYPSCGCQRGKTKRKYGGEEWIGRKFGKLTVDGIVVTRDPKGRSMIRWNTTCDCGNKILAVPSKLALGVQTGCVCVNREETRKRATKHGESHTRLFTIWVNMRDRCNNPKNKRYDRYGGRGISVCNEWNNNYEPFRDWSRENGYDENAKYGECTLDRIDVNGNYEPSNCRWTDIKTQQRNRTDNRIYEIDGRIKSLAEWCEDFNTSYSMVENRIRRGWDVKKALETSSGGIGANRTTFHEEFRKKEVERKYHITRRFVEVDGEILSLKRACIKLGLPYQAVYLRITRYGMSIEEAINKPFPNRKHE